MMVKNLVGLLYSGVTAAVAGFICLFFSSSFGTALTDSLLVSQGGLGGNYQIILQSNITVFLIGIGMLTILLTGFKIIEMKNSL